MNEQISYCVLCDALPGECDHTGARYLDPIVYEQTAVGWRVPDYERQRWDNPPKYVAPTKAETKIVPIHRLIVELEGWMDLNDNLEQLVRAKYELDAGRTSRIVEQVLAQAERGTSTNPPGLLTAKLREIR